MKKLKNIPTYYNFPGTPVFRDTTALPFKNGGNLDDPKYEEGAVYTWSGDADSYYRFNITRNQWEYLNNKTRSKTGKYIFQPVKNKKTIKQLENEAVVNPAAKEQLLTWASDPSNYGVSFLVADEGKVKGKRLTFEEKQARKKEYLDKNLPIPSWLSNIGAESLALYFNNVDNMSSDELYKKGMSMGPTAEGAKYLEMAKVQYENEQIKKANSMQKAISEGSGWQKGVMGMPTKKRKIEYTPIPTNPLPYSGQADGVLITREEQNARDFFNYLKNNKEAAQKIIGKELTEEELFNETGGYDNFAQTDLYQNFANEKTIDKIEEQKYQDFLKENQEAKDEAGVVFNTLDFMRSLATDLPATTYNLFQGKMPLYQQSRGLGGEDPDTYNYYKRYTDAGGYGFLNALNDTYRMVTPVANAQDAVINYGQGNYGSSALLGLGAIPLIGSAFKLPGLLRGASALNLTDDAAKLAASGENIVNAETAAVSTAETAGTTGAPNYESWQSGIREIVDNPDGTMTFHYNDGGSYTAPAYNPVQTGNLAADMGIIENNAGTIDLTRRNLSTENQALVNPIETGSTNVANDIVKNLSGFTKEEILSEGFKKYANISEETKDALLKMSDEDFTNSVIKPDGTIVPYRDTPPVLNYDFNADRLMVEGTTPLSLDEYIQSFNSNLPRLNEIIAANNKTGVPYFVKELKPFLRGNQGEFPTGSLVFESPSLGPRTPTWKVGINPGKFTGEVQDFASSHYHGYIPGLNIQNSLPGVFSDYIPRTGSGTYDSINQYLKELELGRVKAGFNSQTESSFNLWKNAVNKGKAYGFLGNPTAIYGTMKTVAPVAIGGGAAAYLTNPWEFDQSGYDAYGNMGLTTEGKSNAYGGPLNDRNINGKLLQSTYASPLGNMFREGGPFGEDKGTFDYANSIYASQPGNYYNNGGPITKLNSTEEKAFQNFYNTLPENLQTDDSTYDIRGYWDGLGRPSEFDYNQPKESDGYYHGFSINPNTGEYLKSPAHETFQHAVDEDRKIGYRPITNLYGRNIATYNPSIIEPTPTTFLTNTTGPINYRTGGQFPRPYSLPEDSFKQGGKNLHNSVYASSNAQYPAIYKQGGNINVVAGGEKHRVYIKESPTGMGEGVKGHVMVTHPTMDKGKWDTIDLTVKARAKTIEQGIAATKKWHKENPNVYRQGGSVLSMSNTPQLQGEGKDLTYPDNAYIYAGGGLIKRADGSYSQRGLWDNIRANIGSGKKPTKQMLQQEKKINKNYK